MDQINMSHQKHDMRVQKAKRNKALNPERLTSLDRLKRQAHACANDPLQQVKAKYLFELVRLRGTVVQ